MVARYLVAIAVIGLVGAYAGELRAHRPRSGALPALERLPREMSDWQSEDITMDRESAKVLAADASLHRCYRNSGGMEVWISLDYFSQQQVNSQIHSPRNCIPGGGWTVTSIEQRRLELAGGAHTATRMTITRNGNDQELWYWFRTRGGTVSGEYALKWDLVKSSLARRPTDAAFLRYNAQRSDSTALRQFIALIEPQVDQILGEVGL